jgi:hypothetical protein
VSKPAVTKSQGKTVPTKGGKGDSQPPVASHPPTPPAVRPVDLASLRNVRQELEYVYWQLDRGDLADRDGRARTYVLSTIYQVLASGLEKRVEAMEKAMRERGFQLPDAGS